ncbi:cilia- and flagella-associated protein 157 [Nomia melanderi]|uniref:cilia- and flagella-associated protein 157 n=1 Tax=Nomia melanderi TaxID=2448451 RepID=UPI0013045C8E|nr:cilia- and flagella-associated protein 157 [Nomia melanderi]
MLKAKRKKRKGGKKKAKKKCMDERETVSYEQEILDNNRQLARLRTRNEELELEAKQVKDKFRQLEEDRSDVIAHLKRNLEERIEESKELAERLSALEELRKEELAAYKRKEESMELEYRTMENNLNAEVKLITGKLNALEDWRIARQDLMQKFEVQEKEIIDQEKRHQNELYEAEKSLVIGKAMMKKEMEEHLKTLAVSLRKATNLRVAEATNRAIRENVALNLELDDLVKTCKELEITSRDSKEKERTLKLQCELFETESKVTLNMAIKQRDAIHKLSNDFQSMLWYYGKAERDNARIAVYESTIENYKKNSEMMEQKIDFLKKCISKARIDREQLLSQVCEKDEKLKMLKDLLHRVRSCILKALELKGDISSKDYCASQLKQQFLQCLWEILESNNMINIVEYSASQIENITCHYSEGDLGLIEPLKTCKCENEERGDTVKCSVKPQSMDCLVEKRLSSSDSDISSSIQSPKESIS